MDDEKVIIDVAGMSFDAIVDTAEKCLATNPLVYQRSGELVSIIKNRVGGVGFTAIKPSYIRYILAKMSEWREGKKQIYPLSAAARCLISKNEWKHINHLRGVVPFPVMLKDGSLNITEGYNKETEVYFSGGITVDVPTHPTLADAKKAIDDLLEVVVDFPFVDNAHRSSWIAALLSPISRYMHQGSVPLMLLDANSPRVGKTRLVRLIAMITTGEEAPFVIYTRNPDEERKRMFALLKMGRCIGLLDNVVGCFGSPGLNALATGRYFEDRVLGGSKTAIVLNDIVWYITANNVSLAPDTAERCQHIRLQSSEEQPHLRSGFKHEDLFGYVLSNRSRLLSSAFTILRAYVKSGMPKQQMSAFGSFEEWHNIVGGALVWCGMDDPAKTRIELERTADVGRFTSISLIDGWLELQAELGKKDGVSAKDAKIHLDKGDGCLGLRDVLFELTGSKAVPSSHAIGRLLHSVKDRPFEGKVLRCVVEDKKHGNRWAVLPAVNKKEQ